MALMVTRAFLAMLIGAQTVSAQDHATVLRDKVVQRISAVPGATVAVVFREVGGGTAIFVNPDSVFHAASTMKVPVMIEYFRGIDARRIRRDQDLLLGTEFKSIVDGSPYTLDAGVDSDSSVFALPMAVGTAARS